jgi:hypothetical protein
MERTESLSPIAHHTGEPLKVFTKLKSLGFSGPIMVEGTAVGATLQETIANARANREFLEKIV